MACVINYLVGRVRCDARLLLILTSALDEFQPMMFLILFALPCCTIYTLTWKWDIVT